MLAPGPAPGLREHGFETGPFPGPAGCGGQQRFDDGFRADLGFIGQVGYDQDFWGATRHWWGDKDDVFNHITLNFRWNDMVSRPCWQCSAVS